MRVDLSVLLTFFLFLQGVSPLVTEGQICTRTNFGTTNLVSNGDFELGNDGSFSSDYSYVSPPAGSLGGGQYTVDNDAQAWNGAWFRTPPNHGGGGDLPAGNFYLADGGNNANDDVYSTDVTVVAGNTYIFSAWVANIHTNFDNPPEMEFYVGTDNIGSLLTSGSSNDWGQFYAFWQAPSSGTFTIALRNAVTGTGGNDLAIDNVFFTRDCDNLVNFEIETDLPDSIFACGVTNQNFETGLNITDYDFEWKEAGALGSPLGSNASYATTTPGTYYVCVDPKGLGCPVPDTIVYIQAITPAVAGGALNCGTMVADFTASIASGPSDFKWFDELTDGTEIGAGPNFTTPVISCGAPTYYLENSAIKIPSGATAGADFSDGTIQNQYTSQNFHHLEFDVKKSFTLESVQVRYNKKNYGACSGTIGNSFGIELRDNTNTQIYANVPDVPCGSGYETVTIPLGWKIDVGTAYQLRLNGSGTGTEVSYLNNGADYSVGGPLDNAVVHITGNVSTNSGDAARYGAFFNWVMTVEDACPRVPAVVTSSCGTSEICNNGIDDDCDGLIDCYDPDCLGSCTDFYYGAPTPVCQEIPSVDPNFGLDTVWSSVEQIETRSGGVVGDIDGDGIPEIVAHKWYTGPARRSLVILDGQTGQTEVTINNGSIFIDEFNSIATIGDVDGDGTGEIFQVYDDRKLYRFEHDGTLTWSTNAIFGGSTADNPQRWVTSLADFDGDGIPEAYVGNDIYNSITGALIAFGGAGNSHGVHGPNHGVTVAADVLPDAFCADCSGLELVAGNQVYSVNIGTGTMTVVSSSSDQDGVTSIADWNCDGELDIIISRNGGKVYVWDPRLTTATKYITTSCDGSAMAAMPVTVSSGGPGPINVGDFDGDGEPELGVAGSSIYVALENDLSTMWSKAVVDVSNTTASSTFDFEGDGNFEVVYRDEDKLYVLDGITGNERASYGCVSGTRMELPIVADVNGDGEANILVTCAGKYEPGPNRGQMFLFTSNTNTWVKTRKVWNQHAYNPVVIGEDLIVPSVQQNHAIVPKHNVFLANSPFVDVGGNIIFKPVPDLQGTIENVDLSGGCTGNATASFTAFNSGDLSFPTNLEVAIYQGDPAIGGTLLSSITLDNGNSVADNAFTRSFDINVPASTYDLYLVVNDDGTDPINAPTTPLSECDSTNNITSYAVTCPSLCNKPTSVTIAPTPVTGCENTSIDLAGSYVDGGVTPLTDMNYVWYKQGTPPVAGDYGATAGTIADRNFASAATTDAGTYVLRVEDGTSGDANCYTESTVVLTVNQATAITTQPSLTDTDLCPSENFILSVTAVGTNLNYQWKRGVTNVGTDSPNLSITGITAADAGTYTVEITGDCGTVTSNGIAITVGTATAITTQPSLAVTDLCPSDALGLSVVATGDNLSYQWKRDASNVGTDSPNLNIASVMAADAGTYTVEITGDCGTIISTGIAVTVGTATSITTQPSLANTVLCPTDNLALNVVATGDNLSYQWKRDATNVGTDSPSLSITGITAADAGTYSVEITGDCGTVISTGVAITVGTATAITTQPSLAVTDLCPSDALALSVVATGDNLSYQWKRGTTNVGTNSPNFSIAGVVAADAGMYTVEITGDCGAVTSTSVSVTVGTTTSIITQPFLADADLCPSEDFTLNVVAAGDNLTYEWFRDATSVGTGTSLTITNVSSVNAGSYTVVVTGDCGNATSTPVIITIGTTTVIDTEPDSVSTCANSNVGFGVSANGDNLSYQWQKDGGNIPGEIVATFNMTNVQVADEGNYTVVVTGDCGIETSTNAALAITATEFPTVTIAPIAPICEGGDATIQVTTSNGGGAAPTYTYYRDGFPIAAATAITATSHTLTGLTATTDVSVEMTSNSTCIDGGATNPVGSNIETIQVDALPDVSVPGSTANICTDEYTLSGNLPVNGNGLWTSDNVAVTYDDASLPGALASGIPLATTVTFTWTISNGICTDESNTVAITRLGDLTSPNAGADQVICEGDIANLTGNTPGLGETGTWTAATGLVQTGDNATVTGLTAGTTTYTYTMGNGTCPDASATVDVIVISPAISNITLPIAIGSNATQSMTQRNAPVNVLSTNPGADYRGVWGISGAGTGSEISPTTYDVTDLGAFETTTIITWTVTDTAGVCPSSVSTLEILRKDFTVAAAIDDSTCVTNLNGLIVSGNTFSTPDEIGSWISLDGLTITDNGASATITQTPVITGPSQVFKFEYSVYNTPLDTTTIDTASIVVYAIPIAPDAGLNDTICTASVNLNATVPTIGNGSWSVVYGTGIVQTPSLNTSLLSSLNEGDTVRVEWAVTNNLCATVSDTVQVIRAGTLTIPMAGNNDIQCETTTTYSLTANAAGIGEMGGWSSPDGGISFDNNAAPNTTVNNLQRGENQLIWTISNSFCSAVTDTITIELDAVPTVASLGTDFTVCAEPVTITGNTPTIGVASWSVVSGSATLGLTTGDSTEINSLSPINEIEYTISNGTCPSTSDQLIVTKVGDLTASNAGLNDSICSSIINYTLQANTPDPLNGETGNWLVQNGSGIINDPIDPTSTVNSLSLGFNELAWVISNGVCPNDTDYVSIFVSQEPSDPDAGKDTTICGTIGVLEGITPLIGTGQWIYNSGDIAINNSSNAQSAYTILATTTSIIWRVSTASCPDKDAQITISSTSKADPSVTVSASDNMACEGIDTVIFRAHPVLGGSPTYKWYVNGLLQTASLIDEFKTVLTANSEIIVEMESDLSCVNVSTDRDSITIGTEQPQVVNIVEIDQTVCDQFLLTLQGYSFGAIEWYRNNVQLPLQNQTSLMINSTGNYHAVVTGNVCPDVTTSPVTITIDVTPKVDAGTDKQVFEDKSVYLEGRVDTATTIEWTPNTYLNNPEELEPLLSPQNVVGGYYTYVLTASNGNCASTDSVLVLISTPLKIPNAFSPNGDGINDFWIIGGLETYPGANVTVYNRWGNIVFEKFGYSVENAWDGSGYPVGTYYYILNLPGQDGVDDMKARGALTITK